MTSNADLRIVLLGKTGSGKSSSGNTILNRDSFLAKQAPVPVTRSCQKENVDQGEWTISMTDTPGLFDKSMSQEKLKSEIEKCVEMSVPGPHVFLLVIRLGVRFTEEENNTVKWIQKNFGEDAVKYTIVLFTHADELGDETLEEYVKPCNDITALLNQYGSRYHSFNNNDREGQDQVRKLLEKIDEMVEGNGGMYYTNDMYKEAQRRIDQENFRLKAIEYGTTALTVVGGLTGGVVLVGGVAAVMPGGLAAIAAAVAGTAAAVGTAAAAAGTAAVGTAAAAAAGTAAVAGTAAAVGTAAAAAGTAAVGAAAAAGTAAAGTAAAAAAGTAAAGTAAVGTAAAAAAGTAAAGTAAAAAGTAAAGTAAAAAGTAAAAAGTAAAGTAAAVGTAAAAGTAAAVAGTAAAGTAAAVGTAAAAAGTIGTVGTAAAVAGTAAAAATAAGTAAAEGFRLAAEAVAKVVAKVTSR